MTRLVLLHKQDSIYDDLPDQRYHFPNRSYLSALREAVGDWIVYHEPGAGGGRRSYFAIARVVSVEPDPERDDHSYATVADYLDFSDLVPLHDPNGDHYESDLQQPDGSTNRGRIQRAVRRISDADYLSIRAAGLRSAHKYLDDLRSEEVADGLAEDQAPYDRPMVSSTGSRPFRDVAFRHAVLRAYDSHCAFTDLKVVNGRQRVEVDAAHIRPVGDNHRGSDSIRNGLALSKTVHWLFDRGIIAVSDDFEILESPGRLPDKLKPLFRDDGLIRMPERRSEWPSPVNLRYHRDMFEDCYGRFSKLN
ncbi:MAG: HNH endonuclease [Rhodospirillales bacterium]|nr:HNH endonuclease [Rhodospirillales bacterium]